MNDQALIGWLCVWTYNFSQDCESFHLPGDVHDALVAKGWCLIDSDTDWQGRHGSRLTDAGRAIYDLNAAEFGIDSMPECAGSD